jgi:hypothetical protein
VVQGDLIGLTVDDATASAPPLFCDIPHKFGMMLPSSSFSVSISSHQPYTLSSSSSSSSPVATPVSMPPSTDSDVIRVGLSEGQGEGLAIGGLDRRKSLDQKMHGDNDREKDREKIDNRDKGNGREKDRSKSPIRNLQVSPSFSSSLSLSSSVGSTMRMPSSSSAAVPVGGGGSVVIGKERCASLLYETDGDAGTGAVFIGLGVNIIQYNVIQCSVLLCSAVFSS